MLAEGYNGALAIVKKYVAPTGVSQALGVTGGCRHSGSGVWNRFRQISSGLLESRERVTAVSGQIADERAFSPDHSRH
jgi:hypothetical protein